MDKFNADNRGPHSQSTKKNDEQWSDLKGIVPEHLMPQGAFRDQPSALELSAPDAPDAEKENIARSATAMEWLREKFPDEDVTRLVPYYAKGYGPEYYACIETGGWRRGTDAALNEEGMLESVKRAQESGLVEYIWHSAMDDRVCPRCAANNGKVFRYDIMPPGGHPGLAAGCRCWAEPKTSTRKAPSPRKGAGKGGTGCLVPTLLTLMACCALALVLIS